MEDYLIHYPCMALDGKGLDRAFGRLQGHEERARCATAHWLRSYVMCESAGAFGLACVFRAASAEMLECHVRGTQYSTTETLPIVHAWVARQFAPAMVYAIRRRSAWATTAEMDKAIASAGRVAGHDMRTRVRWLRSYGVREGDGSLGSWCLYQAVEPLALQQHAARSGMPSGVISSVIGRVVYRDDDEEGVAIAGIHHAHPFVQ